MTVYVDESRYPYGRMIMCHMLADTVDELHEMADMIGVARRHFQNHSTPHYDICKAKRALAIDHGAEEADRSDMRRLIAKYRKPVFH